PPVGGRARRRDRPRLTGGRHPRGAPTCGATVQPPPREIEILRRDRGSRPSISTRTLDLGGNAPPRLPRRVRVARLHAKPFRPEVRPCPFPTSRPSSEPQRSRRPLPRVRPVPR